MCAAFLMTDRIQRFLCFPKLYFSKSGGIFYFQSGVCVKTTREARNRWEIKWLHFPSTCLESSATRIDDYGLEGFELQRDSSYRGPSYGESTVWVSKKGWNDVIILVQDQNDTSCSLNCSLTLSTFSETGSCCLSCVSACINHVKTCVSVSL